jgi:fibronectin type 3 domain-containing protein
MLYGTLHTRVRPLLAAVVALAIAFSCGLKTAPQTPDSPRPETVKDLKGEVRDTVAFLAWAVPTRNVEGKEMPLSWISGFRVYRAEIDPARAGKKPRYREAAKLSIVEGMVSADVGRAELRRGRITWSDPGLKYGRRYSYRVRAESVRGGESQPSEEVRVAPLLTLAEPKGLVASGEDSVVALVWDAVTTRADGSAPGGFVGYNVYRRTEGGQYEGTPLNPEPLRAPSYRDTSAINDTLYRYIVRSVDSPAKPWRESLDSAEASATPRDRTAPAAPGGLTVVPGVGRIFLTWNENRERDLAGYHVYRSTKSGKDYDRLTEKPINRTTYSDETVSGGMTYYYVITAVDQAGNESGRSKERKAFAEKLR